MNLALLFANGCTVEALDFGCGCSLPIVLLLRTCIGEGANESAWPLVRPTVELSESFRDTRTFPARLGFAAALGMFTDGRKSVEMEIEDALGAGAAG